ncbi:ThuA domain-containing protein [Miniimonas sp. S16]|uniref:ThuA domain-containing protein n=1 Tax=Miniimonas sp. S16 TaxID=2171623 RepID=UPI000D527B8D|nr:ThuA domain-containing protein [Miniimonas sp. S16]
MSAAVVLSGRGRYADPWHPFEETSGRIARLLRNELELAVDVVPTVPDAVVAVCAGPRRPDLLVVDAGGGAHSDPPDDAWRAAHAALTALLATGVPLLGVHGAANAFTDVPAYRTALGGHWVEDVSFHPERGPAHFTTASEHPILAGLTAVDVPDEERYSALERDADVGPLLTHVHDGVTHVSAWAREDARGRVVFDALGHHGPSYDAPARCDLLVREARWLTA